MMTPQKRQSSKCAVFKHLNTTKTATERTLTQQKGFRLIQIDVNDFWKAIKTEIPIRHHVKQKPEVAKLFCEPRGNGKKSSNINLEF